MGGRIIKHSTRLLFTLLLALVLIGPLLVLLFKWLKDVDEISFSAFTSTATVLLIGKSLLLSTTVALLATLVGTVCGFLLYKLKNFFVYGILIFENT